MNKFRELGLMGISNYALEFLLNEHCYRAITGNVVTIGQEAINLSAETMSQLLRAYGCVPRGGNRFEFEFEGQNQRGFGSPRPVSVGSLFAAITTFCPPATPVGGGSSFGAE